MPEKPVALALTLRQQVQKLAFYHECDLGSGKYIVLLDDVDALLAESNDTINHELLEALEAFLLFWSSVAGSQINLGNFQNWREHAEKLCCKARSAE